LVENTAVLFLDLVKPFAFYLFGKCECSKNGTFYTVHQCEVGILGVASVPLIRWDLLLKEYRQEYIRIAQTCFKVGSSCGSLTLGKSPGFWLGF
jgi:hypothetical protein